MADVCDKLTKEEKAAVNTAVRLGKAAEGEGDLAAALLAYGRAAAAYMRAHHRPWSLPHPRSHRLVPASRLTRASLTYALFHLATLIRRQWRRKRTRRAPPRKIFPAASHHRIGAPHRLAIPAGGIGPKRRAWRTMPVMACAITANP